MWDFLERWFGGGFMPHGHCYLWSPGMVWTQVTANTLIGLAYLSISATLSYLVWRVKLPFSWIYIAFGVFILACGMTHFLDVVTVWHPIYWADAGVRVVTAAASVGTAFVILPLVPKIAAIAQLSDVARERGEELETAVHELTEANASLQREQEARAQLAAANARLEERARTQQFQERFLAILGHDLRNPLAAVEMGAALLRQSAGAENQKILNRIDSSSRRMSRMIEQILDLTRSRLDRGLVVTPTQGDLASSLRQVVDELRLAHPERHIELALSSTLHGAWDRDRLEQVLSNLVGNAIVHGASGSPISVDARAVGSEVVVRVHNDGQAIPPDLAARLFDPFRRGERDSRTAATSGLGLGLYISREIAIAHGGSLEFESASETGTTFELRLPHGATGAAVGGDS
jgi:signal transduction histidine kinase